MSTPIRVKVTVDTDELREWAGKHADAGHHGVAHVLYKAASDSESLSEQVIREARAEAEAEMREAWEVAARRRNEARRYYVAWMSARMRAQALAREVSR